MIDRARVTDIFTTLGEALGQAERQTQDIDVWRPASEFDDAALALACRKAGMLFDPTGDLDPRTIYLQVVRPGIVSLPSDLALETIARFGPLTVAMPEPAVIAAAKLTRASERDIEDVVWWVRHRDLRTPDLESAIARLPRAADRETARENLVIVRLVAGERA